MTFESIFEITCSAMREGIARDIQVVSFLGDSLHRDSLGIALLFLAELVGVDDLGDVLFREAVLAFAFLEVFGGVDEEHVVRLLALLEYEDTDRNAGGVEQIGRQADDGVDVAVLEQLGADALLRTATEQHAVGSSFWRGFRPSSGLTYLTFLLRVPFHFQEIGRAHV